MDNKEFGLQAYMNEARKTAMYVFSDYPLIAMAEEVGEVMGKIAKQGRKNNQPIWDVIRDIKHGYSPDGLLEAVEKEMGDVLWQWANLCHELGFDPAEVARKNIDKLQGRQERGTLNGEGDNR